MTRPAHHDPNGGFRNPWPGSLHGLGEFLRWRMDRVRSPIPPDPERSALMRVPSDIAMPRAPEDELRVTWVGHSTFLLQVGGLNVLTDPMWSMVASPIPPIGPRRWVPPAVDLEALPPIDLVLLSHNHYDHLDARTVRWLARRQPRARWAVPLGLAPWLARRGVRSAIELDWWEHRSIGRASVVCTPAQHFSARGVGDRNRTLWCSWVLEVPGRRVYFGGDSALHPEFRAIGERHGPFDLTLLPIGAYEPRWFMRVVHMNPEEAVAAFEALQARRDDSERAVMVGMHWGTFKLTDEPMDEPPRRTRAAWRAAGLPPDDLWILRHGESRVLQRAREGARGRAATTSG